MSGGVLPRFNYRRDTLEVNGHAQQAARPRDPIRALALRVGLRHRRAPNARRRLSA
jgi:hypothetical protein